MAGLLCGVVLCSGCYRQEPRQVFAAFDAGLNTNRPVFLSHIEKLGFPVRDVVLRENRRQLYDAALWILAVPSQPEQSVSLDDSTAVDLARYVRSGGKLLCAGNAQGWGDVTFPLNVLGEKIGFHVLPHGTRRPRNLAPELIGEINAVNRSFWSASEIQWSGDGKVLLADEDLRAMVVSLNVGKGRVVVVGHVALLDENPQLTQRLFLWMTGAEKE